MSALIYNALAQGFNSKQIIDYIIKKFPSYASKFQKALAEGFTHDQIIENLTEHEKTRKSEISKKAKRDKIIGTTALTGASLAVSPYLFQAANNVISNALPSSLRQIGGATQNVQGYPNVQPGQQPPTTPQILNPLQNQQNFSQQPPVANVLQQQAANAQPAQTQIPNIQQQQQGQPPTQNLTPTSQQPPVANVQNNLQNTQSQAPITQNQPQQSQVNVSEILNNLKSKLKVDDLIKLDWSPEQIKAYFTKFHPDVIKNAEKLSGTTFEDIIGQYIQEEKTKQSVPEIPEESNAPIENTLIEEEKLQPKVEPIEKVTSEEVIEPEPVKKQDIVVVPQGVGEVREIRNGKAIVEIDGKLHKVDESEIEEPPLPRKEMADLYEDLKNEIESQTGEEVSRHVTFLGYDPNSKQLIYMPWRGQPYTYNDVTDEEIANLRDKINRKTSGENFIGVYQEGTESPIGAAMSEFIQRRKAQQKEKGIEKKEPIHKAKFEKLYYAYEPAEKAAEARYKERKKQTKKNTRVPKSNVQKNKE